MLRIAAVLAEPDELNPSPDLLRQRVFGGSQIVSNQSFRKTYRNNVRNLLTEQFVAAVAELLLRLDVQQNNLAALVYHHHRIRGRFQQPTIAAFHLRQVRLRGLAHADVANCRRHQGPFGAFQRAQHDLDRKLAAVLPQPDELDPGSDLLRQRILRGSQIVRDQPLRKAHANDVRHLLTEQFVPVVAELFFRLEIEKDYVAALIHHHHRIGSSLQQPAVFAFDLRQALLVGFARADIADCSRHQSPFRAFQRAQHDLDRKFTTVLAPPGQLDPGSDLLRRGVFRGTQIVRHQPFRKTVGYNVCDLLTEQFIAAVAELFLRLNVQ